MSFDRDYQLSLLSEAAYSNTPPNVAGFHVIAVNAATDLLDGFFAYVFQNDNDPDDIVIAFRGSEFRSPFDPADLIADAAIAAPFPSWNAQFTDAIALTKAVIAEHQNQPGVSITVTGHSLGGALAQVAAAMFKLSGAAFDPGGAANLVASQDFLTLRTSLNGEFPNSNIDFGTGPRSSFKNYFIQDSLVSGYSGDSVNGNNFETLDFFAYAESDRIVVEVATKTAEFLLSGRGLSSFATATTAALTTFVFHGIHGITTLMSIKANDAFDEGSELFRTTQQAVRYLNATGNIGFSDDPPTTSNPQYTLSPFRPFLVADNGANQITATSARDTIFALGGDDSIQNVGLGDTVDGGSGIDLIVVDLGASTEARSFDARTPPASSARSTPAAPPGWSKPTSTAIPSPTSRWC